MSLFKLVRSACIVGVALAVVAMLSLAVPSGSASAGFPGFPPVKTGTSLSFTGATITKAQTTAWAKDAGLEAFSLTDGKLEEGALIELVKSATLTRLELKRSLFVHSELRSILEQSRIRHLSLEGCLINELPVMDGDKAWPMDVLDLSATQVGSKEPTFLTKLVNLSSLNLSDTEVTTSIFPMLAKYSQLRTLDISNTKVSPLMSEIGPPRNLTNLACRGLGMTPRCLEKMIGGSPGLISLDLANVKMSDQYLVQLAQLKKAVSIVLTNTGVTSLGVDTLAKALPTCVIVSDFGTANPGHDVSNADAGSGEGKDFLVHDVTFLGARGELSSKKLHGARIDAALQWLVDHQNPSGYWSGRNFLSDSQRAKRPTPATVTHNVEFKEHIQLMWGEDALDKGQEKNNVGLTGLALLAFLSDGHTPVNGVHWRSVAAAYKYLLGVQSIEGCFGPSDLQEYNYSHAICTSAFAELQLMWPNDVVKRCLQRAVDYIVRAQNPGSGWKYGVRPKNSDTSVTSWMVHALRTAEAAGATFDTKAVYGGANAWLDAATHKKKKNEPTRVGYKEGSSYNSRFAAAEYYHPNYAMDACAIFCRLATGNKVNTNPGLLTHARGILQNPPAWRIPGPPESSAPWRIDMYFWYWSTLALFYVDEDLFGYWARVVEALLLDNQRGWHSKDVEKFGAAVMAPAMAADGSAREDAGRWLLEEHGSWDPVDPWGNAGGRVYSTAINVLTLSVSHRFQRFESKKKVEGATVRPFNKEALQQSPILANREISPAPDATLKEVSPRAFAIRRDEARRILASNELSIDEKRTKLRGMGTCWTYLQCAVEKVNAIGVEGSVVGPYKFAIELHGTNFFDARNGEKLAIFFSQSMRVQARPTKADESKSGWDPSVGTHYLSLEKAERLRRGDGLVFRAIFDAETDQWWVEIDAELEPLAKAKIR